MASGLRAPSGIGFGPDGLHCVSDNQGEWLPGNKLQCIQEGGHYGFQKPGANNYYNPFNSLPYTPPTAWVVQDDIGNSPTAPLYVSSGTYAGQMLMGDARWGTGINRYFLEKNSAGNLQAAIFIFTGGLEGGAFRMLWGPDGHLYVGMVGGRDDGDGFPKNMTTANRVDYGLQKLRHGGGPPSFEMLAVRSRSNPQGFEIEFTQPVNATLAQQASSYLIQSYHMAPAIGYGAGSKQSSSTLTPSAIQVSPDGRKVFLTLSGIAPSTPTAQRVIYLRLNNFKSAAGDDPWATETWYTLNAFAPGAPFDPPVPLGGPLVIEGGVRPNSAEPLRARLANGSLILGFPASGPHEARLRDARGALLRKVAGRGSEATILLGGMRAGVVLIEVRAGSRVFRGAVVLP
jgi:hypothetical protein